MFKHILVPTDGSEFSDSTIQRAISFAKEAGAEITAFYAQPDYLANGYYGEAGTALVLARAESAKFSQEYAEKILNAISASCREAGVKCSTVTQSCLLVYEGIIDVATKSGCDLIFMASHGRSGVAALLLGSETQKVLTHSRIPVLVYR